MKRPFSDSFKNLFCYEVEINFIINYSKIEHKAHRKIKKNITEENYVHIKTVPKSKRIRKINQIVGHTKSSLQLCLNYKNIIIIFYFDVKPNKNKFVEHSKNFLNKFHFTFVSAIGKFDF